MGDSGNFKQSEKGFLLFRNYIMNFFSDLQHDYEEKASKWSVNFQGPEFDIPDGVKEDVALIGPMCEEVATTRKKVEKLSNEIAQQEQELQNIRQTQISMNLEFQEFEKLCFELQQKEKDIGQKINILEKKHREKNSNDEGKNADLRCYVDRAKDHLGLSIARTATDSNVLIFTNIDMANPTRKFLCEFQLGGINNREYKVMRCEPEIEGIKDMEKKVNETNDISGFVVTLRKKFKTISK